MTKCTLHRIELRIFPRHGHRRSYVVETRGAKVVATFGRVGHRGRTIETECGNANKARKMMVRRALVQLDAGFRPVDSSGRCLRGLRDEHFRDRLHRILASSIAVVSSTPSKSKASRRPRKIAKRSTSTSKQADQRRKKQQKKSASKPGRSTRKQTTSTNITPASKSTAVARTSTDAPVGGLSVSPFPFGDFGTRWSDSFSRSAPLGPLDGVFNSETIDDSKSVLSTSLASKSFSALATPNPKPLLLWVDDKPENNGKFVRQIVAGGAVEVVQLTSTRQSKNFLLERRHLAEADQGHFRIITDRTRQEQGEELFEWNYRAGEELIIWLRENGWTTPAMLFCSQPEEALQLEKQYAAVRVSRTPEEGIEFGSMRMTFTT